MTIGIDIGGTNLSLGQVRDGKLLTAFSTPSFSADSSMEETLDYLVTQIKRLFNKEIQKIGIGVPTIVDVKRGIVYDAQNIPSWKEVPLKDYLENVFQVPVAVNNDANCYALGVYAKYPDDAKPESLVTITLGTGTGFGLVFDGRLYCGANCGAGELGCLPYKDSIIEDYCSKKFFTGIGWPSKEVSKAAVAGDSEALLVFDEFGQNMGALLCDVLYAYDPTHVALGGGVANTYKFFCHSMERYLREHFPYKVALDKLKVDIFTDSDIPVLGASML